MTRQRQKEPHWFAGPSVKCMGCGHPRDHPQHDPDTVRAHSTRADRRFKDTEPFAGLTAEQIRERIKVRQAARVAARVATRASRGRPGSPAGPQRGA